MKVLASIKKLPNSTETSEIFSITPEYKICDGDKIRKIDDNERKNIFPNSGQALFIANYGTENSNNTASWTITAKVLNKYNEKLLKVDIDMDNQLMTYEQENINSCKYGLVKFPPLKELNQDEIIEIIDKSNEINDIQEIINLDSREIVVRRLPLNKRILIILGEFVYGPFEYSFVGNKKDEDGVVLNKIINITACTTNSPKNGVYKYKLDDIKKIFCDINLDFDNRRFIYCKKELDKIKQDDNIDFIDNNMLVNLFKKIVKNSEDNTITNNEIKIIKKCIPNCETIDFKESKLQRLDNISKLLLEDIEFATIIRTEFMKSSEWKDSINKYIDKNKNIIEEIAKKDLNYDKCFNKYNEELQKIRYELDEKNKELENVKLKKTRSEKVEPLNKELDAINKVIFKRKKELEQEEEKLKNLKEKVDKYHKIENLNYEVEFLKRTRDDVRNEINKVKDDLIKTKNDTTSALAEYIKNNNIKETFDKVFFSNELKEGNSNYTRANIKRYESPEDILSVFKEKFEKTGRELSQYDIVNILISISMNFITVFAGEPGVGKTSICKIIGKAFGVYSKRFANIPVERGWTSSKDLIGYYNPISNQVEKTNEAMFDFLNTVDIEQKKNINDLYIALLDEANLSSIEHYWSNFMQLTDDYNACEIELGGNFKYSLSSGVRFLATINYDHTTESLSDRFLDRACVVLMNNFDRDDDVESYVQNIDSEEVDVEDLEDLEEVMDFDDVKKYFGTPTEELKDHLKNEFSTIINILQNNKVYISKRSKKNILKYCSIAQKYMDVENGSYLPLDYAVSQKLLPMLKGHGDEYKKMLESLADNFEWAGLNKCKVIVDKMITIGEEEYGYYQFFTR